jgi:cytochrome c oxidase subunit II
MRLPLLLADAQPENLSMFDPVSPPAESIRTLTALVLAITAGIFLIVEGVLLYNIYRFRRGRAAPGAGEPPQVYGSNPIEIAWTAAPALISFTLALVTARTIWEVRVNPDAPPPGSRPLRVTVVGHQWWWEYVYDRDGDRDLGVITANELHIPASNFAVTGERRPVYLALQSADVAHSYWVPRLAGKTDVIPGKTNSMWFETDRRQLFLGQCAEFCGTQHANMLLRVQVDAPEDFERWLENEGKPAVEGPAAAEGKAAFLAQSCVNCHRVRGTRAAGNYAPDLTHLMSRKTLASGMVPNTPTELRRWVADPQKVKPGCLMPAFKLSDRDLDLVVGYLLTLK